MKRSDPPKAKLFSAEYLFYDFVRITTALPGLIAFRPRLIFESPRARRRIRGGALIISNHTGFADPIFLMYAVWYRRQRFICMMEFFKSRARWWFEHFLCIPVERDNFGMDSFRTITSLLKSGHVITMFPEGHIGKAPLEGAQAFKSGMVLMAASSGVPIVPVYLKKRPHWYSRMVAVIGEPVEAASFAGAGKSLSFAQVDAATRLLFEKSHELGKICERYGLNNGKKHSFK